ncbi:hypothetical protein FMN50_15125 [Rhodobacterales bacterium]|nr:hypothetical protein FMN50_15125 [Rhodobacterales bacterium]
MRISRHFLDLIALAAAVFSHSAASAEDLIAEAAVSSLQESYDEASPTSGIPLAGLALGIASGNVDLDNVRLTAHQEGNRMACVIGRTRDGRFYSENPYLVPGASGSDTTARLDRVTDQFAQQLAVYDARAVAFVGRVISGDNCNSPASAYLPQVIDPFDDRLSVAVNSGSGSSYVSANLLHAATGLERAFHCETIQDGATIAFDTECFADISDLRGHTVDLELVLDDGIGEMRHVYSVVVPARGTSQ